MNSHLQSVEPPPIPRFRKKAAQVTPSSGAFYDMTQAVPNVPTPLALRQRIAGALVADEELSFYTDVPGLDTLRGRIAERHALAPAVDPAHLVITAGANHAMFTAFVLHFQAGDHVALPAPYYFNYDMGLRMLGIEPVHIELREDRGFALDAADMIEQIERRPAKGLVLVTPNNPTGATYAPREVLTLLEWACPRGMEVILDETYARYDDGHLREPAIAQFLGNGLTLVGSFSKVFSLTGYRVGYITCGPHTTREAHKIQDTLVICAPHISQLAALWGLEACEEDVRRFVATTRSLATILRERTSDLRAFALRSCGGFFAYLRHPFDGLDCEDATLRLYEHTGILGLPGTVFGASQQRFIRLAFCNLQPAALEGALVNLAAYDRVVAGCNS